MTSLGKQPMPTSTSFPSAATPSVSARTALAKIANAGRQKPSRKQKPNTSMSGVLFATALAAVWFVYVYLWWHPSPKPKPSLFSKKQPAAATGKAQ